MQTYRNDPLICLGLSHAWGATNAVDAAFDYNAAGLRSSETTAGSALMTALGRSSGLYADFTYTAHREVDVAGQFDLVGVDGKGSAVVSSGRDYNYDQFGNRTGDQSGSYTPNALNQYSASPGVALLEYDFAGNLTSDGSRTYTYDAENRVASVTQGGTTSTFKYDYLGRRISKQVGAGAETRFIYDGWNLIAEISASTYAINRTYYWGLDASGSLQGGGGVGGLLCAKQGTITAYPIYDGSSNIIGLYDGSGSIIAAYRYDPFGNLLAAQGYAASINPFGFSTKYTDRETGLVYYGLRYYHPALGRFINRDPIEEQGGLNLYAFCGNDGVNRWDKLGMEETDAEKAKREAAEAAAETAREEAEREARRQAIERYGLISFFAFGFGDADVEAVGRTAAQNAYEKAMQARLPSLNDWFFSASSDELLELYDRKFTTGNNVSSGLDVKYVPSSSSGKRVDINPDNLTFEKRMLQVHDELEEIQLPLIFVDYGPFGGEDRRNAWWIESLGRGIDGASFACALTAFSGRATFGSNWKIYLNGWGGNRYVETILIREAGQFFGQTAFAAGLALDAYTLYENPNVENAAWMTSNTAVGVAGFMLPFPENVAVGASYGIAKYGYKDMTDEQMQSTMVFSAFMGFH